MKRMLCLLMVLLMVFPFASAEEVPPLEAQYAALLDAESGELLYAKNAEEKAFPASTTKLLTVFLGVLEGDMTRTVTASERALDVPVDSSLIPLAVGETITLRDLLYATMIRSGNEGAQLIAETISGSAAAFVDQMNSYAVMAGCTNTHFTNANGYHDPGHYTTAHDMARLALNAMQNETFREIARTVSYTLPKSNMNGPRTLLVSQDSILNPAEDNPYYDARVIGIKSGYHAEAGYCFVGAAEQNGRMLISVVMNSTASGRWTDTTALLDYGFSLPASSPAPALAIGAHSSTLLLLAACGLLPAAAIIILLALHRRRRKDTEKKEAALSLYLTNADIDAYSALLTATAKRWSCQQQSVTRIRLTMEEILLNAQAALGENTPCTLSLRQSLGECVLTLSIPGAQINSDGKSGYDLMGMLGVSPAFSYTDGVNAIQMVWTARPHLRTLWSAAALLLSLAFLFVQQYLPKAAVSQFQRHITEPAFTGLMHLVTLMIGPLLFLTIVQSLSKRPSGQKDTRRIVTRFLLIALPCGLITLGACLPFVHMTASLSGLSALPGALVDVLLLFIKAFPVSIFSPFVEGNMLQLLFLSLLTGFILRLLGPTLPMLRRFVDQALLFVRHALQITMTALPLLLFFCVQRLASVDLRAVLSSGGRLLLIDALLLVLIPAALLLIAALRMRVSPLRLLKRLLPSLFTTLASPSPLTAYPLLRDMLGKRMNTPFSEIDRVLPIGMIVFKVGMIVHYTVLILCAAMTGGITIDMSFLLLCWITVFVFSIVYLPTSYGNYAILIAMFAQLSLPASTLSFAMSVDMVLALPATACSSLCLMLMTLLLTEKKRQAARGLDA